MKAIASTLLLFAASLTLRASGAPEDTTFKKDNPKLFYTTREYFVEIPSNCYSDELCIQEFFLIMTFNVGINSANEIKQIGFKEADLSFDGKTAAGKTYKSHTFTNYTSTSSNNGYAVKVDFVPDKTNGVIPILEKFVFTGTVSNSHLSGILSFQTKTGVTEIPLN